MPREKPNYRDMLDFLVNVKKAPLIMNISDAARVLGVSRSKVYALIANGSINTDKNNIAVGALARYLCG